jgi:hypothetical protein
MKLYADISKTEEQDDGTIKVWGYASSEVTDSDGETVTADAMKAALPGYMKFGAVREMHQPKAAGTAIEANVEDDGRTFFGAHIVDAEAVKKVKANVYKGFSIGGKVTKRDEMKKSVIKGLNLVEISLVDRPANPEAIYTMYKAEMVEEPGLGVSAEPEKTEDIQKGMYDVSNFAQLLNNIGYLASDTEWESQSEGDNSPIPQAMRDWLSQGIVIFQAMAAEETAEMMARLQAMVPASNVIDSIHAGAKTDDLAKAGAKFSTATKAALKAAHDACKAADKALADLGYDQEADDEDAGKTDNGGDLAKLAGELDTVKADLVKASDERDILKKRVAELEAQPAPTKGAVKAITVEKSQDTSAVNDDAPKSAFDAIKKAHQTGGRSLY